MYVDFEEILKPVKHQVKPLTKKEPYTKEINQHIPSGFCVYSKFAYGKVENPLKPFRGKDCVEVFCDYVKNEAKRLYHMFLEKPMELLTLEQWKEYNKATNCHICFEEFQEIDTMVRDHCHYTGQYRGPAHRSCNLVYKILNYITIIFHNLRRYDAHQRTRQEIQ